MIIADNNTHYLFPKSTYPLFSLPHFNFCFLPYSTLRHTHTTKLNSFEYQIDSAWPLWISYRYTEIQTNEWDSVPTYSCPPTTYRPPTNHLLTINRPLTDHLLTDQLPTTYWPLTDHLPTTYRPPTNHLPTTYRRPTDHLPTTFLWCSSFRISLRHNHNHNHNNNNHNG